MAKSEDAEAAKKYLNAVLELVGIRDDAEDAPEHYLRKAKVLGDRMLHLLPRQSIEFQKRFRARYMLENCFIQVEKGLLDEFVTFLQHLRKDLLEIEGLVFRAMVDEGEFLIDARNRDGRKDSGYDVRGFSLNSEAAKLFARQKRLKGVGICVAEVISQQIIGSRIRNFFVVLEGKNVRYQPFWDISIQPSEMRSEVLHRVTGLMTESFAASPGMARFFVPLLINWASSLNVARETIDDGINLDGLLAEGRLKQLRAVPGMELVYCCLVERLFAEGVGISFTKQVDDGGTPVGRNVLSVGDVSGWNSKRSTDLVISFLRNRWLHNLLLGGNSRSSIPTSLLSAKARRNFAKALGELDPTDDKNGPVACETLGPFRRLSLTVTARSSCAQMAAAVLVRRLKPVPGDRAILAWSNSPARTRRMMVSAWS
jgi:hypothetical protein